MAKKKKAKPKIVKKQSEPDLVEFECIVEYCYIPKQEHIVVRFLSGESYSIDIHTLPKNILTHSPDWENLYLSPKQDLLLIPHKKGVHEIPPHVLHSKGTLIK